MLFEAKLPMPGQRASTLYHDHLIYNERKRGRQRGMLKTSACRVYDLLDSTNDMLYSTHYSCCESKNIYLKLNLNVKSHGR